MINRDINLSGRIGRIIRVHLIRPVAWKNVPVFVERIGPDFRIDVRRLSHDRVDKLAVIVSRFRIPLIFIRAQIDRTNDSRIAVQIITASGLIVVASINRLFVPLVKPIIAVSGILENLEPGIVNIRGIRRVPAAKRRKCIIPVDRAVLAAVDVEPERIAVVGV